MGEYDTKRTKATPTAGPSEADRFGTGKVARDLHARVIKFEIEGGTPKLTIASGTDHGTRANMTGYVRAGVDGVLAEFQIFEAKHGVSYAYLPDVTPEDLAGHLEVVINPSSRPPQPAANLTTRVIHVEVIPLGTRITIPRGRAHGITVGTPGHLRTKEGRGAFVVSNSQLTRCQAIVHEPVDYVSANQEVILQRLPPKLRDGAVQRRAAGTTSTDDVHTTARAGVDGASSPLPFADIIQRAFGKHDISKIRTQVGGPATRASEALGARAYATGNTIAFATAPDLHTAAHEAAHVVQQARGAVGFQGLGAADDEHERHADAVADAVVAGESAEPLLDTLVSVGSSSTAVQRAPMPGHRKRAGMTELHAARRAAQLIERLVPAVPQELQALQAARELANPAAMRRAAAEVIRVRGLLELSSASIREGLLAAADVDRRSLEASLARASATIATLREPADRALRQADALIRVQAGSLADLPRANQPDTPEATRDRASAVSPLGLCDDPTMQHAQSRACPLDIKQRDVLRADVAKAIALIADNWLQAANDKQLSARLKPLFEAKGLDPITGLLLTALEVFGPKVSALLRQRQAVAASETLEHLVDVAAQGAIPTDEDKLLFGLYKKMSSSLLAPSAETRWKSQALFDVMREARATWELIATRDIRQLPDPVLVAVAEALQTSPYSIGFFREKLVRLVSNYEDILKIGKHVSVEQPEQEPLVAVRVRHPKGFERIALARATTRAVAVRMPHHGPEPADDSRLVKDGNYAFHDWVDRSLVSVLPATGSKPILASNDPRWRSENSDGAKAAELARWHDDPTATNDVNMLAVPQNPFVPKVPR